MLHGNVALVANTMAMAAYYIFAKQLVAKYHPANVTAWAYITASACMGLTVLLTVERTQWTLPKSLMLPLLYWVFAASILGYYALTWAISHLPASQVTIDAPHGADNTPAVPPHSDASPYGRIRAT